MTPSRHWSALETFILKDAGLFDLPKGRTAKDRIKSFLQDSRDEEFESLIQGIPQSNMAGGGAFSVHTDLNLLMGQFGIPALFNAKEELMRVNKAVPEKYSFDDPLPDSLEEVDRQLDYYHERRGEGMEGSIFRDQVDVKIQALEHKRRQLSERQTFPVAQSLAPPDPVTDQVQEIVTGFKSKTLIAVAIVIIGVIIALGSFTESLEKIYNGVSRALGVKSVNP